MQMNDGNPSRLRPDALSRRILASRRVRLVSVSLGGAMVYGYYWAGWGRLETVQDFWLLAGSGIALIVAGFAFAAALSRCPSCGHSFPLLEWPAKCAGCGLTAGSPIQYSPEEETVIRLETAVLYKRALAAHDRIVLLLLGGVAAVSSAWLFRSRKPVFAVAVTSFVLTLVLVWRSFRIWVCPGCGSMLDRGSSGWAGYGRPKWGTCPGCRFDPGPEP